MGWVEEEVWVGGWVGGWVTFLVVSSFFSPHGEGGERLWWVGGWVCGCVCGCVCGWVGGWGFYLQAVADEGEADGEQEGMSLQSQGSSGAGGAFEEVSCLEESGWVDGWVGWVEEDEVV